MAEDKKDFTEDEIRKTLWINTFQLTMQMGNGHSKAKEAADEAVKGFDKFFSDSPETNEAGDADA